MFLAKIILNVSSKKRNEHLPEFQRYVHNASANRSVSHVFHDGQVLATAPSGPPPLSLSLSLPSCLFVLFTLSMIYSKYIVTDVVHMLYSANALM